LFFAGVRCSLPFFPWRVFSPGLEVQASPLNSPPFFRDTSHAEDLGTPPPCQRRPVPRCPTPACFEAFTQTSLRWFFACRPRTHTPRRAWERNASPRLALRLKFSPPLFRSLFPNWSGLSTSPVVLPTRHLVYWVPSSPWNTPVVVWFRDAHLSPPRCIRTKHRPTVSLPPALFMEFFLSSAGYLFPDPFRWPEV